LQHSFRQKPYYESKARSAWPRVVFQALFMIKWFIKDVDSFWGLET